MALRYRWRGLVRKQNSQVKPDVGPRVDPDTFDFENLESFQRAPLYKNTIKGLTAGRFFVPTAIQKESLGWALKGHDILGAAKTGSGKTLAFVIPILERLAMEKWSEMDGLGALIITPTRELAFQIFKVLNVVGAEHSFSAALLTGGRNFEIEKEHVNGCNIIVCTPGRLLQHMDETPLFDTSNLKILVLDEADRILDMGFRETIDCILENIPTERQTLLFSATQTKSVKDLARLSLKDPKYISVHERAAYTTPVKLQQQHIVVEQYDKVNVLYSFINSHPSDKILVFVSCCKQVIFFYHALKYLLDRYQILGLHGNMHQSTRMRVYEDFSKKEQAVLVATDVAARGLDFPGVTWVVQLDCPQDAETYIHRAGRTARFRSEGRALLVLTPHESRCMVQQLEEHHVPIHDIEVNHTMFRNVRKRLELHCSRTPEFLDAAQRCFSGYLKFVSQQGNKEIFDVTKINLDKYARSLGLVVTPRVRFLQQKLKQQKKREEKKQPQQQRAPKKEQESERVKSVEENDDDDIPEKPKWIDDKTFAFDDGIESDEDIFVKKTAPSVNMKPNEAEEQKILEELNMCETEEKKSKIITKYAVAKKILNRKNGQLINERIVFDDDGQPISNKRNKPRTKAARELLENDKNTGKIDLELSKKLLSIEDKFDRQEYFARLKRIRREERLREKEERRAKALEKEGEGVTVVLGGGSDDDDDDSDDGNTSEDNGEDQSEGSDNSAEGISDNDYDDNQNLDVSQADQYGGKRKLSKKVAEGIKRFKTGTEEEPVDTGLSLEDDEAIALKLLARR